MKQTVEDHPVPYCDDEFDQGPRVRYAIYDQAHGLSQLFRVLKRGERAKSKLDYTQRYSTTRTHGDFERELNLVMNFRGAEPLGIDDEDVLLAIIAMCGIQDKGIANNTGFDIGYKLRTSLQLNGGATDKVVSYCNTSLRALALTAGYQSIGKTTLDHVRSILRRLATTNVIVTVFANITRQNRDGTKSSKKTEKEWTSQVLSYVYLNGELHIAINHQLTQSIYGKMPWSLLSLDERKQLSSEACKVLHRRLTMWASPTKALKIGVGTLSGHVWPGEFEKRTLDNRKSLIRRMLKEIDELPGWEIREVTKDIYSIKKPGYRKN